MVLSQGTLYSVFLNGNYDLETCFRIRDHTLALRVGRFAAEADAFHEKLGARNSVINDLRMLKYKR